MTLTKTGCSNEKDYGYLDNLEEYDSSEREGSSICDDSYTCSYPRVDHVAEVKPQLSRSDRKWANRELEQGKANTSSKSAEVLDQVHARWGG
jgi:hypothetical protein